MVQIARFLLIAGLSGAFCLPASADLLRSNKKKSLLPKEEGAVYLEELLEKEIKLKVNASAKAYFSIKGKRYLGTLYPGQQVTLLAVSDRAYRVRGKAQQGQIAGWVHPKNLTKLDKNFVESMKKLYERQQLVEELIANKQVALGMTMEEVEASMGKPDRRSANLTRDGQSATYEYVTYKRVPQYQTVSDGLGRYYRTVTYVKVETGKVSIDFQDGIVSGISEKEGDDPRRAPIRMIPRPIPVGWR